MRGTKAKRIGAEAYKQFREGVRVGQVRNNQRQAMTSPVRFLYQALKGRRAVNGMMRMG